MQDTSQVKICKNIEYMGIKKIITLHKHLWDRWMKV